MTLTREQYIAWHKEVFWEEPPEEQIVLFLALQNTGRLAEEADYWYKEGLKYLAKAAVKGNQK